MDKIGDAFAYLVNVGSRPVPYIFAGLVVGLLNEQIETYDDNLLAIASTILVASGLSLMILPPWLCLKRWADSRYKENCSMWPVAYVIGVGALVAWMLLLIRYAV